MLHTCSSDNEEEAAAWEAAWHSDAWLRALALFLRKVYGSPVELAVAMLDMLGTLYAAGWTEGAEPSEQAYVHTLGVAGLLLEQLASVRPALAARSAFTLQELLDVVIVRGLRNRSAKVRRGVGSVLGEPSWLTSGWPAVGFVRMLATLPSLFISRLLARTAGAARGCALPWTVLPAGWHPPARRAPDAAATAAHHPGRVIGSACSGSAGGYGTISVHRAGGCTPGARQCC